MNIDMLLAATICSFLHLIGSIRYVDSALGLNENIVNSGRERSFFFNKSRKADFESDKNVTVVAFGSCR